MVITSVVLKERKEENLTKSIDLIKANPDPNPETEIITIRLNSDERLLLNELKKLINEKKDSTVLKEGLIIYKNVLHNTLGIPVITRLTNSRRVKNEL